jgi:hypothetical protein
VLALHRLALSLALGVAAPTLAACGTPPIGPLDGGPPAVLHLGEGELAYREIVDGDVLLLARGCQGSQHVFVTLRTEHMDPRGMIVRLTLERESDGELVSMDFQLRLSFTVDPAEGFAQLTGIKLPIPEPESGIGHPLIFRVSVEDRDGTSVDAERRVEIAWGTQICETPETG